MAFRYDEAGRVEAGGRPSIGLRRNRWSVVARILEAAVFVGAAGAGALYALPGSVVGSPVVIAAATIATSVAFTGILVPCITLLISQAKVVGAIELEELELRRELDRGRAAASSIRREQRRLEAGS